jgi:hypothetical protein
MTAAAPPAWNIFKQIFGEHWDGFKHIHPRYNKPYSDSLVDKMLGCGEPETIGAIAYRDDRRYRIPLSPRWPGQTSRRDEL